MEERVEPDADTDEPAVSDADEPVEPEVDEDAARALAERDEAEDFLVACA